jgi:hypothetical protein
VAGFLGVRFGGPYHAPRSALARIWEDLLHLEPDEERLKVTLGAKYRVYTLARAKTLETFLQATPPQSEDVEIIAFDEYHVNWLVIDTVDLTNAASAAVREAWTAKIEAACTRFRCSCYGFNLCKYVLRAPPDLG